MLDAATTSRPRRTVLVLLVSAALASLAVFGAATMGRHGDERQLAHASGHLFGTGLISLWGPLRQLGCAPPNEHGSFIARKLLPDENGNPYIFECTDDGLMLDGVHLR